jgi:hypothetical protein
LQFCNSLFPDSKTSDSDQLSISIFNLSYPRLLLPSHLTHLSCEAESLADLAEKLNGLNCASSSSARGRRSENESGLERGGESENVIENEKESGTDGVGEMGEFDRVIEIANRDEVVELRSQPAHSKREQGMSQNFQG